MSARCFISYKAEDSAYSDIILGLDTGAFIRAPDESIECYSDTLRLGQARKEILGDCCVTIFLIGAHSAESMGYEEQKYIKRELAASLCRGPDGYPSGVIGVVLPEAMASVYKGTHFCEKCGKAHESVVIDDSTVIREFSNNFAGACPEDKGYCMLVKWSEFKADAEKYIEEARTIRKRIKGAVCNENG